MPCSRMLLAVVLVGSVGAAAACGTSGYQFVENEDFGVFAKVPDDWAMFNEQDLRVSLIQLGQGGVQLERTIARTWFRGFDASNEPSAVGTLQIAASEPRGFVQIEQLTVTQREQINLTALRGFDPIAAATGENNDVDVRVDEPAEFDGGYHGVHTVYATNQSGGGIGIIDKTIVLDPTNSVLYTFVVACSARCYDDTHSDEIATIVDSWTIEEDGS